MASESQRNGDDVCVETRHVVHDSRLMRGVLPPELRETAFQSLQEELRPLWSDMRHKGGPVPRLVCLQGDVLAGGDATADAGSNEERWEPLYRHPADEQPPLRPWTPLVRRLRDACAGLVGQELNHALIQLYRDGDDCIREHADKTLDVARGSGVVNLSVGAARTMILRPKRHGKNGEATVEKGTPRPSTRVTMEHASLFVLGWETNRLMTHEIKRDKRDDKFKAEEERAFGGARISITLRKVATFINGEGRLVGQGAPKRASGIDTKDEEDLLLRAFSVENRQSEYDWEELYGEGFSVVNFRITNQLDPSAGAGNDDDAGGAMRGTDGGSVEKGGGGEAS